MPAATSVVKPMSPFCYKLASNVQASVQEEIDTSDVEQAKMRIYIVQRCKRAAATLYGDPNAEQVLLIRDTTAGKAHSQSCIAHGPYSESMSNAKAAMSLLHELPHVVKLWQHLILACANVFDFVTRHENSTTDAAHRALQV